MFALLIYCELVDNHCVLDQRSNGNIIFIITSVWLHTSDPLPHLAGLFSGTGLMLILMFIKTQVSCLLCSPFV